MICSSGAIRGPEHVHPPRVRTARKEAMDLVPVSFSHATEALRRCKCLDCMPKFDVACREETDSMEIRWIGFRMNMGTVVGWALGVIMKALEVAMQGRSHSTCSHGY